MWLQEPLVIAIGRRFDRAGLQAAAGLCAGFASFGLIYQRMYSDRAGRKRRLGMAGTDYAEYFESAIARLKSENRYRTFANLERDAARFPVALWRPENAAEVPREVTIWCSNDYLGMGGHAKPPE